MSLAQPFRIIFLSMKTRPKFYIIRFFLLSTGEPAEFHADYLKGQKGEQGFNGLPGAHGIPGDIGPRGRLRFWSFLRTRTRFNQMIFFLS